MNEADKFEVGEAERFGEFDLLSQIPGALIGQRYIGIAREGTHAGRLVLAHTLPPTEIGKEHLEALINAGRTAKAMRHPNVAAVLAVAERDDEIAIVSEYVDAETLYYLQTQTEATGAPIPLAAVVTILSQLLTALCEVRGQWIRAVAAGELDAQSTLHGGITPGSVLVATFGESMLADLGIAATMARISGALRDPEFLPYRAPEQLDPSHIADERCDCYAFGVIAWELLANRPFLQEQRTRQPGESEVSQLERLTKAIRDDPIPTFKRPGMRVPGAVGTFVNRALRRDPARRFPSLNAMRDEVALMTRQLGTGPDLVAKTVSRIANKNIEHRLALQQRAMASSGAGGAPASARVTGRPPPGDADAGRVTHALLPNFQELAGAKPVDARFPEKEAPTRPTTGQGPPRPAPTQPELPSSGTRPFPPVADEPHRGTGPAPAMTAASPTDPAKPAPAVTAASPTDPAKPAPAVTAASPTDPAKPAAAVTAAAPTDGAKPAPAVTATSPTGRPGAAITSKRKTDPTPNFTPAPKKAAAPTPGGAGPDEALPSPALPPIGRLEPMPARPRPPRAAPPKPTAAGKDDQDAHGSSDSPEAETMDSSLLESVPPETAESNESTQPKGSTQSKEPAAPEAIPLDSIQSSGAKAKDGPPLGTEPADAAPNLPLTDDSPAGDKVTANDTARLQSFSADGRAATTDAEAPAIVDLVAEGVAPAEPKRGRRWPLIASLAGVTLLLGAAALWLRAPEKAPTPPAQSADSVQEQTPPTTTPTQPPAETAPAPSGSAAPPPSATPSAEGEEPTETTTPLPEGPAPKPRPGSRPYRPRGI